MTPAETPVGDIIIWAAGLSMLLSFGTAIWTVFSGPSRKNTSRLDGHSDKIADHAMRLNALEQAQRTMPTKDDMHSVSMALEGMKGEMKAMSVEMRGNVAIMERLEVIVSRHENHLLKG